MLADTLRRAARELNIDSLEDSAALVSGGNLWQVIPALIQKADAYILLITPASLASQWCRRELDSILHEAGEKPIIPVLAGGVSLEEIPPPLQHLQYLDLRGIEGDQQSLNSALRRLFTPLGTPGWATRLPDPQVSLPSPSVDTVDLGWPSSVRRMIADLTSLFIALPIRMWWILGKVKLVKPSSGLPPETTLDHVHFTVTAPTTCAIGEDGELIVWAHLKRHEKLVLRKAMAALGIHALHKLLFRSVGPVPIERGSVLSVSLDVEEVQVRRPHNRINWTGEIDNAFFIVSVPKNAAEGTRRAVCYVKVDGMGVGGIDFVVRVAARKGKKTDLQPEFSQHRSAFASYASEDRDLVLAAVAGMKKRSPQLQVFLDVMSLRSNDDWQERLMDEIGKADIFYLFWCSHALKSEWVDKEWRQAYQLRGAAFIDPIPLQSPDDAPQPKELSRKHFYDPTAAFMKHAQLGSARPSH
jgi:hypothetical protein